MFIGNDVPSWIVFDSPDLEITPTQQSINVTITANDSAEDTISYTFLIDFEVNNVPQVVSPSGNYSVNDNTTFSYSIDLNDVFNDTDNDSLTFVVSGEPSFLTTSFVNDIFSMSGTPNDTHAGSINITFTANDG